MTQYRILNRLNIIILCVTISSHAYATHNEICVACNEPSSGRCGEQATWTYVGGVLTISGTGSMDNYNFSTEYSPWYNNYAICIDSTIIKNGVTNIGDYAFAWCKKMKSISIPNSVTKIGEHAFHECDQLRSIQLPNSINTIGDYAFVWCDHLPNIDIPESVEYIGLGAFTGCYMLTNFSLPNSCTYIDISTLSWCTNLKYLKIGDNVTNIGSYAFAWCEQLKTIVNYTPIPPIIEENVFQGLNRSSCTLYVPANSIDLYKRSMVWEDFIIMDIANAPAPNKAEDIAIIEDVHCITHKILRDGQILILRGDKTYTLTGQEVR